MKISSQGAGFAKIFLGSLVLTLALGTTACERQNYVRGHLVEDDLIQSVQPGRSSRNEVLSLLGSPSSISSFQDRTWYYIGERHSKWAFLNPDVRERKVLAVSFHEDGTVEDTALYTYANGVVIDPVSRKTPTAGRELTLLEQLFGNIGRFPSEF